MFKWLQALVLCVCLSGCDLESETEFSGSSEQQDVRTLLALPDHMPTPSVPVFNPLSAEKIELGRFLFYDTRLSANQTQSCATCHEQALAFADGVEAPIGSTGHQLLRNSQGLSNVAFNASFTWASNSLVELEDQLNVPIRADNPIELGVTDAVLSEVLLRFEQDSQYQALFQAAFADSDSSVTMNKIIFSLASFVRSMVSANSRYDQYLLGDKSALSAQEIRGFQLFNGEKFECFHCHGGINFTNSYRDANTAQDAIQFPFFNNGLYNVGGDGSYPESDQGLFDATLDPQHRGLFRPPSLRNIALTAPYMHDGSMATLRQVVEHYVRGGRLIESGVNAGDGALSPLKSGLILGFSATEQELDDMVAFLESLTDESFLTDPRFSNPFEDQ